MKTYTEEHLKIRAWAEEHNAKVREEIAEDKSTRAENILGSLK